MIDIAPNIILVDNLKISVKDVARKLSNGTGILPQPLLETAEQTLNSVSNLDVLFGFELFDTSVSEEKIKVNNIELMINNEVFQLLKNSEKLAVFACTVSRELDASLHNLTDISAQYINDVIGTLIIEKSMEYLYQDIIKEFPHLKASNSISPGNCGWALEAQKELFKLLPNHHLGITLSKSGMMTPLKSLSGVIGLGELVTFKHTNCKYCNSKNCLYRKEEFNGF